ncbi:hypothetical protein ACFS7Z_22920 [Pontibacter toksunensis]|uniref:DUF1795 domain-containing protein n=1 Tax=Pontibacter toksunensis TaxID=1332631 RepID=A0ABW6BZU0_9BACT
MRYLAFLAILFVAGVAFAQPKLKKVNITKELSVLLPQDFSPMPDDGIARRYPATTKPLAVFTSPNGLVDFSVTQKVSQFRAQDLKMMKEFYKAALLERHSKIDFIRDEVTQINGKDHIVFEYVSSVEDERKSSNLAPVQKYSMVQYAISDRQMMIFTFHAPFQLKNEWQQPAREIMSSIKIKK